MEAIINFIKEALAGKKMSATWIVTLGIAIGGLVWAGSFAYQEYEKTMLDIKKLKANSHAKVEIYDDEWIRTRSLDSAEQLASLQAEIKSLEAKITSGDTNLEAKITSGDTNLEAKISSGDANLNAKISSGDANLGAMIESNVNNLETKLNREVSNIETNLANAVEGLEKNITNQIDALEKEVDKQDKAINSNENPLAI
jgi:phage host-nuclease inhibitor protein Gam